MPNPASPKIAKRRALSRRMRQSPTLEQPSEACREKQDLRAILAANGLTPERFNALELHLDDLELIGLTFEEFCAAVRRGMSARKRIPIVYGGKVTDSVSVRDNALQLAAVRLALNLHERIDHLPQHLM